MPTTTPVARGGLPDGGPGGGGDVGAGGVDCVLGAKGNGTEGTKVGDDAGSILAGRVGATMPSCDDHVRWIPCNGQHQEGSIPIGARTGRARPFAV